MHRLHETSSQEAGIVRVDALAVHDFFIKNSIHFIPQPLYSPDLDTSDVKLFQKSCFFYHSSRCIVYT